MECANYGTYKLVAASYLVARFDHRHSHILLDTIPGISTTSKEADTHERIQTQPNVSEGLEMNNQIKPYGVAFAPTVDAEDIRKALEPFSDELKVFVKIGDSLFCLAQPHFKMLDGEGVLVFNKGLEVST